MSLVELGARCDAMDEAIAALEERVTAVVGQSKGTHIPALRGLIERLDQVQKAWAEYRRLTR